MIVRFKLGMTHDPSCNWLCLGGRGVTGAINDTSYNQWQAFVTLREGLVVYILKRWIIIT